MISPYLEVTALLGGESVWRLFWLPSRFEEFLQPFMEPLQRAFMRGAIWSYDRVRDVPGPKGPGLGASACSGLALMALAFLIYPLYPFIAALPLSVAGKAAVGMGAYALSWGFFFAGVHLGGLKSWRSLKALLGSARQ